MKKLIAAIIFSLSTIVNAHQIESIRDIPWSYTGVAGDLLQEHKVQLQISELISTQSEETSFGRTLKNKVNAQLIINQNKTITITDLDLHFSHESKFKTLFLKMNNEFEKNLVLSLRYDVITNNFILKELPYQGNNSRFLLKGSL